MVPDVQCSIDLSSIVMNLASPRNDFDNTALGQKPWWSHVLDLPFILTLSCLATATLSAIVDIAASNSLSSFVWRFVFDEPPPPYQLEGPVKFIYMILLTCIFLVLIVMLVSWKRSSSFSPKLSSRVIIYSFIVLFISSASGLAYVFSHNRNVDHIKYSDGPMRITRFEDGQKEVVEVGLPAWSGRRWKNFFEQKQLEDSERYPKSPPAESVVIDEW